MAATAQDSATNSFSNSFSYASQPYASMLMNPYNGLVPSYRSPRSFVAYPRSYRRRASSYYARGRATPYRYRRNTSPPGTYKIHTFDDVVDIISNGHYDGKNDQRLENVSRPSLYGGELEAVFSGGTFNTVPERLNDWKKESAGFEIFEILDITYVITPMKGSTDFSDLGKFVVVVDKTGYADDNVFSYNELMACPSKREFTGNAPFYVKFQPALLEQVKVGGDSSGAAMSEALEEGMESLQEAQSVSGDSESRTVYRQLTRQKLAIDASSIKIAFPGIRYGTIHYVNKNDSREAKEQATQMYRIGQRTRVLFKRV